MTTTVAAAMQSALTKIRWFGCFRAAKKNKDQTTSGDHQNAANQNQSGRHDKFLSSKLPCKCSGTLYEFLSPAFGYYDEVEDGLANDSGTGRRSQPQSLRNPVSIAEATYAAASFFTSFSA